MKKIKILGFVEKIEKLIITSILFALLLIVLYSTIVFIGLLFEGILSNLDGTFSRENNILKHLHTVFGGFLLVLIGIELLHTVKVYLKEDIVHVEVVLLVAIIGVSRHVIDLDMEHLKYQDLIGIGILITALSLGYYLIKKSDFRIKHKSK